MDSILETIKKMLGLAKDFTAFDTDIIVHINSAMMVLNQLGVGPSKPFSIKNYSETWDDFLKSKNVELVKSYIYIEVRLLFDPPSNSFLVNALEKQKDEYEWRLTCQAEEYQDDDQNTITPISNEEIDRMFGF